MTNKDKRSFVLALFLNLFLFLFLGYLAVSFGSPVRAYLGGILLTGLSFSVWFPLLKKRIQDKQNLGENKTAP